LVVLVETAEFISHELNNVYKYQCIMFEYFEPEAHKQISVGSFSFLWIVKPLFTWKTNIYVTGKIKYFEFQ
jgi:hypothetical protein